MSRRGRTDCHAPHDLFGVSFQAVLGQIEKDLMRTFPTNVSKAAKQPHAGATTHGPFLYTTLHRRVKRGTIA